MMHELALELLRQGHEPFVITPGPSHQKQRLVEDAVDEIPILRFRSGPVKDISKVRRAINESLLSRRAWGAAKNYIQSRKVDSIIYYSPSIFFGGLVNRIKSTWNCPSFLILRDLFPQWVIDNGMIKEGSPIARYFRHHEGKSYAAADHIGLMSLNNQVFFQKNHPTITRTCILPNWASQEPSSAPSKEDSLRHKLGLQDKVIFFYGGNIGHAQDMSNLMKLALAMKDDSYSHFLFIGQGDEVGLVQSFIQEHALTNATYLPPISQDAFKKLLHEVDIGLFSLSRDHTAHNFPGKLLGYMVNEIPILGSVNHGNDLLDIIQHHEAGFAFVNGEDAQLLESARKLASEPGTRKRLGENARKLLIEHFSVESASKKIIDSLTQAHGAPNRTNT
ncbi:glycosyltransferase family 4 protein [Pseudogulbenkiania subflava]|uniref:Glycosyltransferase involved in cell wall bisynthesis n=1 Tax=Pseudogulbenkiania subflava DSM 22618 TaxID=1123014 RepID=A0A1Y6BI52_9NEIS|nr:glycosyltransferase family 4 protein [Pseudogulbenkiania subflava]SMF10639.1 Glycosyltransferase involved in cell wall bisynthesis [Pseudogulbenkiania subflava DSM 22618]